VLIAYCRQKEGDGDREMLAANIRAARYNKKLLIDGGISDTGRDFISKLLEPDPIKRLCASEALHHPWITGVGQDERHVRGLEAVKEAFNSNISQSRSEPSPRLPNQVGSPNTNANHHRKFSQGTSLPSIDNRRGSSGLTSPLHQLNISGAGEHNGATNGAPTDPPITGHHRTNSTEKKGAGASAGAGAGGGAGTGAQRSDSYERRNQPSHLGKY
jgi:serine/threonine protein kinase